MAAYRRVYDSRHLQAECQEPGSSSEPYARQSSRGLSLLFILRAPDALVDRTACIALIQPIDIDV